MDDNKDQKWVHDWARFRAVDESGQVHEYEEKPKQESYFWASQGGQYDAVSSLGDVSSLAATKWKESLQERAASNKPAKALPQDVLASAAKHMIDRASTYDNPDGERSMLATVSAFKAVAKIDMTEEQGWLFMALLKMVRSQQGDYKLDNYEDLCAYGALMAESANEHR